MSGLLKTWEWNEQVRFAKAVNTYEKCKPNFYTFRVCLSYLLSLNQWWPNYCVLEGFSVQGLQYCHFTVLQQPNLVKYFYVIVIL
jgi:hypothetical protein